MNLRAQTAIVLGTVAAAGALVGAGCGSCKDDPKPAQRPAPRPSTIPAPPRPGGLQVRRPDLPRPAPGSGSAPSAVMTKLSLDEATPEIPAIPGVAMLVAPSAAPQGAQVNFAWCIAAVDKQVALETVEAGLSTAGWTEIHSRGQGARVAIAADKKPYRLSASISASPRANCAPADGKWFASVQMYKLEAVMRPPALDDPAARDVEVK